MSTTIIEYKVTATKSIEIKTEALKPDWDSKFGKIMKLVLSNRQLDHEKLVEDCYSEDEILVKRAAENLMNTYELSNQLCMIKDGLPY